MQRSSVVFGARIQEKVKKKIEKLFVTLNGHILYFRTGVASSIQMISPCEIVF